MNTKIFQEAMEIQEELTKWRHELHKIPEIGPLFRKSWRNFKFLLRRK